MPLKEVDIKVTVANGGLLDGQGQSKETLSKQKKVLEEKKRKTLANKKIFEDLERQADEELQKDLDRPKGQGRIFGAGKSKEAKEYRLKLAGFKDMFLAKGNMASFGTNWAQSLLTLNVDRLDWSKIDKVRQIDLDCPMPKRAILNQVLPNDNQLLSDLKRRRNVFIPDGPGLEIVPAGLEGEIEPNNTTKSLPMQLVNYIKQSLQSLEDCEFNSCWSLKSMFAAEDAIKVLPTLDEFHSTMTSQNAKLFVRKGCIFDNGDGAKFCDDVKLAPKDSNVIVGAIFRIPESSTRTKDSRIKGESMRFFPGHFLSDDTFISGQRMASVKGEFIPG